MALWTLLHTPAATGAENMALDEALMETATSSGEWILRVYTWRRPTISFGRNQTARGAYDLDRIRAAGIDVVRRPTGGRAILHHREITYSVTAPLDGAGDLRASYDRINRVLLAALRSLGAEATVAASTSRSTPPGITPCFDHPSTGELTLDGRKLAGSAQWRTETALLQHGSILVDDDQSSLAGLAIGAGMAARPATLSEALGRVPTADEAAAALFAAVRHLEDDRATALSLDPALCARQSALVVRYMADDWTWRR